MSEAKFLAMHSLLLKEIDSHLSVDLAKARAMVDAGRELLDRDIPTEHRRHVRRAIDFWAAYSRARSFTLARQGVLGDQAMTLADRQHGVRVKSTILFPDLLALHVRADLSNIEKRFGIALDLTVAQQHLDLDNRRVVLGLSHCHLRYKAGRGIEVVPTTKYENFAPPNSLDSEAVKIDRRLSAIAADRPEARSLTRGQPGFSIQSVSDGWTIGSPLAGDPRKRSGQLHGFGSVPRICEAELREGHDRGTITFTVATPHKGLLVEMGDGSPNTQGMKARVLAMARRRAEARFKLSKNAQTLDAKNDLLLGSVALQIHLPHAAERGRRLQQRPTSISGRKIQRL
jgi:hypothetical protein